MTPGIRKFALTAHVTSSVGWLGAVVAYLALALTALTSADDRMVRAAYLLMDLVGWLVIIPCSFAALFTGLVQSLGTEWGLLRHYWIAATFVLTIGAITILLLHVPYVSLMAGLALDTRYPVPVRCRSRPCGGRSVRVARNDDAVDLQAVGHDRVRAQATRHTGDVAGAGLDYQHVTLVLRVRDHAIILLPVVYRHAPCRWRSWWPLKTVRAKRYRPAFQPSPQFFRCSDSGRARAF
jgi:hypothetical protein